MDEARFQQLVTKAIEAMPEEFLARLENIDIVVEDEPSPEQMAQAKLRHGHTLLGLYEGVPLTNRGAHYGGVLPDKITVFQKPIEAKHGSDAAIGREIQRVIIHEIAHHFGISDARLDQLGR